MSHGHTRLVALSALVAVSCLASPSLAQTATAVPGAEEVSGPNGHGVTVSRKELDLAGHPTPQEDIGSAGLSDLTVAPGTAGGGTGGASANPTVGPQGPDMPPPVTKLLPGGAAVIGGLGGAGSENPRTGIQAGVTSLARSGGGAAAPEKPIAKKVLSLGGAVALVDRDAKRLPDLVVAWVEPGVGGRYAVLSNLLEVGGFEALSETRPLPIPKDARHLALAASSARGKTSLLALSEVVAGERTIFEVRLGTDVTPAGGATWGAPVATPLGPKAGLRALAACTGDVNESGVEDLVVAWAEESLQGVDVRYAVGFELDAATGRVGRWSEPVVVADPEKRLAGGTGLSVQVAQVTLNPHPDLVVATVRPGRAQSRLSTLVGLNLDEGGKPQRFAPFEADLGLETKLGGGVAVGAIQDGTGGTDLAVFWTEQLEAGAFGNLAYLNNPPLCPPHKPTPEETVAPAAGGSGFSQAAIAALVAAGIRSPAQLRLYVAPYMKGVTGNDAAIIAVTRALEEMRPAPAEDVKPELRRWLLNAFGFSSVSGM